jgi:alanyl-tRNA synthetase
MLTANEIRQQFIDFFVKKHGHVNVPSSPVVPRDDPTLLFTNAGMNQFKPYFLGTEKPPHKRVANTQKCIRAGGKHNDLDDVGKDTYHHTFFEMLGNWSFGDYFKKEAIRWAWELLTKVWTLDRSRLHATVFEGGDGVEADDEAASLWRSETDIDPTHIHKGNKKDNFWEMGDTGPCGPCTEIHIDLTPDKSGGKLVNKGTPQVIEIWNLVFIQFNRGPDKKLTPLPAKHVDTGMGFERVTAVLQGKTSNYDTDVFAPIFAAIREVTGAAAYGGKLADMTDTAYRVIADHIRMLTFALTDGAVPSNVGRGSVLRSVLRRAERFGRQYLGIKEPFLYRLVPKVVEAMGGPFPELKSKPEQVADVIRDEEKSFFRTLDRGISLFQKVAERTKSIGGKVISGKDAFDLHTTYGFFVDITEQMAGEVGLGVDRKEFDELWKKFTEEISGQKRPKLVITAIQGELPKTDDSPKYGSLTTTAKVVGWVQDNAVVRSGSLDAGTEAALLTDRTNFYAEQGGQVGDTGTITTPTGKFEVTDTQKLGDAVVHVGCVVEGRLECGQTATLEISGERLDTMRHHTTTHILNWALRKVLGDHVDQKGSKVKADEFTFDFSHPQRVTPDEMDEVERLVNEKIRADLPVTPRVMPLAKARTIQGVRAMFGEKYPDPVRVVIIGAENPDDATLENSIEFCGGTHLERTGQAGYFMIHREDAVGKGVRRLTCKVGGAAVEQVQRETRLLMDLADKFSCEWDKLPERIETLQEELSKLKIQLRKGAASDLTSVTDRLLDEAATAGEVKIIVGEVPATPVEQLRTQIDRLRQKAGKCVVFFGWVDDGKVGLLAGVSKDKEVMDKVKAGDLVKEVAPLVGGKGGGRPDMAQAGGTEPAKLPEALRQAKATINAKLEGLGSGGS